jgi:hypothetical protein
MNRHEVIALDCEVWRDQAISDARFTERFIANDPNNRDTPENREKIRLCISSARTWNHHALNYHRQANAKP